MVNKKVKLKVGQGVDVGESYLIFSGYDYDYNSYYTVFKRVAGFPYTYPIILGEASIFYVEEQAIREISGLTSEEELSPDIELEFLENPPEPDSK